MEIVIRREGRAGLITLNRPEALNALTHEMALAIETALDLWRHDATIELVHVDATGRQAFCAGGDIVAIYKEGRAGECANANQFWRDEYRLNWKIANYPKPYVAMMDGFVMGGGVGVSAHGSHRIVTEATHFAMPECGIGLIPDVGMTHTLSKSKGRLGEYIGLTGNKLDGADCIYAGVADYYMNGEKRAALTEALCAHGIEALSESIEPVPDAALAQKQSDIDALFAGNSIAEIGEAIDDNPQFAKGFQRGSPLAMMVYLARLREAREGKTLDEALRDEFRYTSRALLETDFLEGIRAQVIDKTRDPQWTYALATIDTTVFNKFFAPAPGGDLELKV